MSVRVTISYGEWLDKLVILEIKRERVSDRGKLANIEREYAALLDAAPPAFIETPEAATLRDRLRAINERLWDIEDAIRLKESLQIFDAAFVELARDVYRTNDQRMSIKREVNDLLGSALVEEKEYQKY